MSIETCRQLSKMFDREGMNLHVIMEAASAYADYLKEKE